MPYTLNAASIISSCNAAVPWTSASGESPDSGFRISIVRMCVISFEREKELQNTIHIKIRNNERKDANALMYPKFILTSRHNRLFRPHTDIPGAVCYNRAMFKADSSVQMSGAAG